MVFVMDMIFAVDIMVFVVDMSVAKDMVSSITNGVGLWRKAIIYSNGICTQQYNTYVPLRVNRNTEAKYHSVVHILPCLRPLASLPKSVLLTLSSLYINILYLLPTLP